MKWYMFCLLSTLMALTLAEDYSIGDSDVDKIVTDEAVYNKWYKCLMDRGPCTGIESFKANAPKIFKSQCGTCSPEVKTKYMAAREAIKEKYPDGFREVMMKYIKTK